MSEYKPKKLDDVLSGFALSLSLLTVGIICLLSFDNASIRIVSYVLITISIIGFTIELSNLKDNEKQNKYFSDINVGVFIGITLYWTWIYTKGFASSALWAKYLFLFFSVVCFYGTYRGVIGLLVIGFRSRDKLLSAEILIQLGGLIIAFFALFISS